jgi:PAS domain S-box-containing protein
MRGRLNTVRIAAAAFCMSLASCAHPEGRLAVRGLLNLQDHNWSTPAALDGEWKFYWKQFIDPADPDADSSFVSVPGKWNDLETADGKAGGRGYASYRLRVLAGKTPPLALRVLHFDTNYRLYVNGLLLRTEGRPAETEEQARPDRRPLVLDLPQAESLDIVIHVSNFHHRNGGFPRSLVLGQREPLHTARLNQILLEVFLCGGLVMMTLYHFALFALRPQDRSPLYFALFCLLVTVRTAVLGERVLVDLLLPADTFWLSHRMEYLSFYLSAPVFFAYSRSLFPGPYFPARSLAGFAIFFALGCAGVLVLPSFYYTQSVAVFQGVTILLGLHVLVSGVIAAIRGQRGARVFLATFLLLFLAAINDILYSRMVVNTGFFLGLALFLFIFTQAFLLSRLYADAFRRVEELAVDLSNSERKYRHLVEDSGEIILSLSEDGTVLSANQAMKRILGYRPDRIQGRKLGELLYEQSNSNLFLARHIFEQRLADLASSDGTQEFPAHFRTAGADLCELNVRLQRVALASGASIIANLAQKPLDVLARHCLKDSRLYSLHNSFSLADLLNYSVTAGFDTRLSDEDQMLMRLGLREVMINAIEHGNLAISFEEKDKATSAGTLQTLIQERLRNPIYANRKLHLKVDADETRVEFIVRDEGQGFNHREIMQRAAQAEQNAQALHGRGLLFALNCFDQVIFNESGNEVRLIKQIQKTAA